jgi:signal transduction histidine kinase
MRRFFYVYKNSIKKHSTIFIKKHIRLELINIDYEIETDLKYIQFIIDQLLSNALKYTDSYGRVSINIMENEKEYVLLITDNGIGIKTEDMPKLFKRTFTGYNGRIENSYSTGLGLYLSQKLANKLGCYITITKLEEGTEAAVHFPKLNEFYTVAKKKEEQHATLQKC